MAGNVGGVPRLESTASTPPSPSAPWQWRWRPGGPRHVRPTDRLGGATAVVDEAGGPTHRRDVRPLPALLESDYHEVFRSTVARFRRRSLLVVVTDHRRRPPGPRCSHRSPRWCATTPLVACVRDPELTAWADGPIEDVDAAFRAGAAAAELRERALAHHVRALGAGVIDAEPGDRRANPADAYINWKIRGVR